MSYMRYKGFIFCIFWYILYGCTTQKKAARYFDNNNTEAAAYCADRFPVVETTDTVYLTDSAELLTYENEFTYMAKFIDSLVSIKCDTSIKPDIRYVIKNLPSKPCPQKVITKQIENTAKTQVIFDSCQKVTSSLNLKLDKEIEKVKVLTDESNKYRRQRNRYLWWVLLLLLWTFRKPIIKLIK